MREPEWHIEHERDSCYQYGVKNAKESGKYIKASISREDIGHLLQGKHIILLFLNQDYEQEGMLDIVLSNEKTIFDVSDKLNEMIIKGIG